MKPRRMKPNACLEWKGRKLMCNGVCAALIHEVSVSNSAGHDWRKAWTADVGTSSQTVTYKSEIVLRRAVNRRFGLPADYGSELPAARRGR